MLEVQGGWDRDELRGGKLQDWLHARGGPHGGLAGPLWEHSREAHGGTLCEEDFQMKVLKTYRTPLQRQIGEALLIESMSWTCDLVLNNNGEWNGRKVPRIRLESVESKEEEGTEE